MLKKLFAVLSLQDKRFFYALLAFSVEMANRRAGDPSILIADNAKIKSFTEWKPQFDSLEMICKSAYEWELKAN